MKKIIIPVCVFSSAVISPVLSDAPAGRVSEHVFTTSKIMPGTSHRYVLYIPQQYVPGTPAAVYISQDGARGFEAGVFDRLIHEGKMPVCIGVFVRPGQIAATLPDGSGRSMRCPQYDALGSAYADFLIEELLPAVAAENNIQFSDNPDFHAIGGNSSGGICAFNAAWERNDFFRRVYMASPSLVAFRGGDILPVLVRKYEPKPVRVYMTVGTKDMNNSSGDWYIQAQAMNDSFKYAGYDFEYEVFEDAGHGAGFQSVEVFERVQKFLWNNWQSPVRVTSFPPRIADVFSVESKWEKTDEKIPAAMPVPFTTDGRQIKTASGQSATDESFGRVSGMALSTDRWRLYISDEFSRFVSVMSVMPDGTLANRYYAGWLHLPDETRPDNIGAYNICVDKMDRLYAATALGVQLIDNSGHNQAIIPLPDGGAVTGLCFGGENNSFLFAKSSTGTVFKRQTKTIGLSAADPVTAPGKIGL